MKKLYILVSCIVVSLLLVTCAEETDNNGSSEKFTAIFDNSSFDAVYHPIDIRQTPDEGYVVLSAMPAQSTTYSAIHLLKADKFGNFVKELVVNDSLVNALSGLTLENNRLYFVCMNTNASARLASVDTDLKALTTAPIDGFTYPSAASFLPNKNFVLLGYDSENKETTIATINVNGELTSAVKGFSTGLGGGEIIIDQIMVEHFLYNGKHFPFSVGLASPGLYYFNGFIDYNFSMAFTNLSDDDPQGIINGANDDEGFSAVAPISGSTFATARFQFGDNYLLPKTALTLSGPSSVELGEFNPLPELTPNAHVKILRTTIHDKNVVLYGSDTRSKQIGLYIYDESTGEFLNSSYLGFSNPYEFADITVTSDGGLAVCGTTYLAGRFPRICIFKLPADEVKDLVPSK